MNASEVDHAFQEGRSAAAMLSTGILPTEGTTKQRAKCVAETHGNGSPPRTRRGGGVRLGPTDDQLQEVVCQGALVQTTYNISREGSTTDWERTIKGRKGMSRTVGPIGEFNL